MFKVNIDLVLNYLLVLDLEKVFCYLGKFYVNFVFKKKGKFLIFKLFFVEVCCLVGFLVGVFGCRLG